MLHDFIARIGAADVHFLGPRRPTRSSPPTTRSPTLFLCASEHEGFCVPLMEAFHMGVPVLAYAATAVPATMDGGGVLYHRQGPARRRRRSIDAVVTDRGAARSHRRAPGRGARAAAGQGLRRHAARLRRAGARRRRAARTPPVAFDFWDQVDARPSELEEIRLYRPAAYQALPTGDSDSGRDPGGCEGRRSSPNPRPESGAIRVVIVNQWVPAAHRGDAIGDSARRVRGLLRALGHESDIFALTDRRRPARRRAAVCRPGGARAAT